MRATARAERVSHLNLQGYITRAATVPEGWPSGLRRTLGKRVYGKPYRGFESHSLRQPTVRHRPSTSKKYGIFCAFCGCARAATCVIIGALNVGMDVGLRFDFGERKWDGHCTVCHLPRSGLRRTLECTPTAAASISRSRLERMAGSIRVGSFDTPSPKQRSARTATRGRKNARWASARSTRSASPRPAKPPCTVASCESNE